MRYDLGFKFIYDDNTNNIIPITYDKLTQYFYPEYKGRKEILFDIWEYYDKVIKWS